MCASLGEYPVAAAWRFPLVTWRLTFWLHTMLLWAGMAGSASSADDPWARRIGLKWQGVELRQALEELASHQQVTLVLDRRVDPHQTVEFEVTDTPFREAMRQCAQQRQMDALFLGTTTAPVLYWGPAEPCSKLAALLQLRTAEIGRLPAAQRKVWQSPRVVQWETYDRPQDIVTQLLNELGRDKITGEVIPHDVWRGATWPALPPAQVLSLLLIQFDLTFRLAPDGRQIRLESIPSQVRGRGDSDAARLGSGPPSSQLSGGQGARAPRPVNPRAASQRFTLTVEQQSLEAILTEVAQRVGCQLQWTSKQARNQKVSFAVQQVSLDQLLDVATQQGSLRWQRQGNVLIIEDR